MHPNETKIQSLHGVSMDGCKQNTTGDSNSVSSDRCPWTSTSEMSSRASVLVIFIAVMAVVTHLAKKPLGVREGIESVSHSCRAESIMAGKA